MPKCASDVSSVGKNSYYKRHIMSHHTLWNCRVQWPRSKQFFQNCQFLLISVCKVTPKIDKIHILYIFEMDCLDFCHCSVQFRYKVSIIVFIFLLKKVANSDGHEFAIFWEPHNLNECVCFVASLFCKIPKFISWSAQKPANF